MTLPDFPGITVDVDVCGGHSVIVGMRVRVRDVLEMLASGATAGEIAEDFPYVGEAGVRAALSYAAAKAA